MDTGTTKRKVRCAAHGGPQAVDVSVVMPVLNAEQTLMAQLDALAQQDLDADWELVVADNGSTDRSLEITAEWSRRTGRSVRIVDASARRGTSHARNRGVAASRGTYIAVCDADDVVEPAWLRKIVEGLGDHDMVGGRLLTDRLNDDRCRMWRRQPDAALPRSMRFLPYATGANVGLRRSMFDAIGGWSEDYVDGGDDIEYAWRAQLAGFSLGYVPDAGIHYRYRSGLQALAKQYYRYGTMAPQLYRDYRRFGAQRSSLRHAARRWMLLIRDVHLLCDGVGRGTWVRKASLYLGRLRGSLRCRVWYP